MVKFLIKSVLFVIYPLNLSAQSPDPDIDIFDQLPITSAESESVSRLFWNAQSIQENVKRSLPSHLHSRFSPSSGCDIKSVIKTEGSADTCELNDDPDKQAKFIYNFNVSCQFGSYQVSVCSREESKLLNQLKVINPERVVSDEEVLDWDSKI